MIRPAGGGIFSTQGTVVAISGNLAWLSFLAAGVIALAAIALVWCLLATDLPATLMILVLLLVAIFIGPWLLRKQRETPTGKK